MFTENITSGDWRCDTSGSDIACCLIEDISQPEFGCYGALNENVYFRNDEKGWQPRSVDLPLKLKVKCFKEKRRKICFFPEEVKSSSWENPKVVTLRGKRSTIL